jgi:hypothetical protein
MTQLETVYAETLNLLGSDVLDGYLQDIVDQEHAAADPRFARELAKRWTMQRLLMAN